MKKALSSALIITLSLILPLLVFAQSETGKQGETGPELLKQELATMEAVFGGMQSFMSELITEVKGNMTDIEKLNASLLELSADVRAAEKRVDDLSIRVEKLESEDLGTFKNKLIELERSMSALSIRIDNNRSKLEGFDQAISDLDNKIKENTNGILNNMSLLEDHEARLSTLEDSTTLSDLQAQVGSVYVIALLALLAGAGALIWGFVGS
jgi:chromosome segregation ATPase